ncbi:MAG: hypothetical protein WCA78_16545 [Rhizomicrobium sp.]
MSDLVDENMRPRYIVVWSEDLSEDGEATRADISGELGLNFGAYEDWPEIPSGADLYDYCSPLSEKETLPKFLGCWQTFSPKLECPVRHKGRNVRGRSKKLLLCIEKKVESYSYASKRWCEAVKNWQHDLPKKNKGFGIIPYSEFVAIYLGASKV